MKTLLEIPYNMETLAAYENKPFYVDNRLTIMSDFEMCYREFLQTEITEAQLANEAYIASCKELKTNYLCIYISAVLYSLEPSSGVFKKITEYAAPRIIGV